MQLVLRAILIYFVLFILFRISGKRTLNESSPFGLILMLLISSSVADSLKDEDRSLTASLVISITLAGIHLVMSVLKTRNHTVMKMIDDVPTLLVRNGEIYEDVLKKSKVSKEDILSAARQQRLTSIEEIRYAILEINGSICVIPKE